MSLLQLKSRIRRPVAVIAAAGLMGCYAYTPVTPAQVGPGALVGIDLTTRAAADYSDRFGVTIDRLEGRLMDVAGDTARIQVERVRQLRGGWNYWAREEVTVPLASAATFQRRALSWRRTAITTAGLLLITWQILNGGLLGIGDEDDPTEPKPIPQPQPG